ncbi:hypothetical protein [Alicyclobacillus shizuokensis]|uniref:hypothetical protein n=1 Tax=Alicyclobacillus shizuokensis TaxID=392014 RepID=UPI000AA7DB6D|nr:hypothetical protein [Alicyclobacillus shizuokensis]
MEEDVKSSVRRQFSQNAGDYRAEPLFAQGDDLQYLLEAVPLTGANAFWTWRQELAMWRWRLLRMSSNVSELT